MGEESLQEAPYHSGTETDIEKAILSQNNHNNIVYSCFKHCCRLSPVTKAYNPAQEGREERGWGGWRVEDGAGTVCVFFFVSLL